MDTATCFEQQYSLVQRSRKCLLGYCSKISTDDLLRKNPGFGFSCIRDLLVHVANCYQAWLSRAMKQQFLKNSFDDFHSIADIETLFEKVDVQMQQFIGFIAREAPASLELNRNGEILDLSPMEIFSHVITHEFHHKGQILSMSRSWGYIPEDTDIIR